MKREAFAALSPEQQAAIRKRKADWARAYYAANTETMRPIKRKAAQKFRLKNIALVNAVKMDSGCVDCGYRKNPVALQFDHRDPTLKHANIARMLTCTWDVIAAEIAKCDVRCANCHAIKSQKQAQLGRPRLDGSAIETTF